MRFCKTSGKRLMSQVVLAGLLFPWATAWAGDDFANWQPKPLVDTSAPATVPAKPQQPAPNQAVQPVQPDLEARLKPVEPFVQAVENRLTITPKPGMGMVQRLNNLQTVLFGTLKYQDAGQLITKLAEVFPEEAKKAQAEMERQAQAAMQANAPQAAAQQAGKGKTPVTVTQPAVPNQMANASGPMRNATKKKRHSFWSDDFDSDFDNDPFFQDSGLQGRLKTNALQSTASSQQVMQSTQPYGGQAATQQSQGPSKLAAVAQGLAGLALVAGGIAGAAFLNGKMGGSKTGYGYPNAYTPYGYPAYGNGYGYNPYGYSPYGYGMNSYGTGMGTYGTGMSSYGYGMGTSSFGSGFGATPIGGGLFMSPANSGLGLTPVTPY